MNRLILLAVLVFAASGAAACESDGRPDAFVIPGPTGPSALPTQTPYVWDSDDELAVWVENAISKGSLSIVGSGDAAYIRIDRTNDLWTLRGPDLSPAPTDVRTAMITYRWTPDPGLIPSASRMLLVTAHFETTARLQSFQGNQRVASATLEPRDALTSISFMPGQNTSPMDVRYFYLHSGGGNRGVLDIDRIALVR